MLLSIGNRLYAFLPEYDLFLRSFKMEYKFLSGKYKMTGMLSCEACQKVYSTPHNIKKHWKRQPLCEQWINLQPGLKDFIDHKLGLENKDQLETNTTCMACKTTFANIGNLNRHLATSLVCSKWDLYNDLEPIHGYMGKLFSEFDAPKYSLCHIIWNVFSH